MATRDELAQILYADANGVITGYTPTADNVASAIIDAYNEHFGTDINIWTPETKTLQVGDTVPNWNAYEKILILLKDGFYKFDASNGHGMLYYAMIVQYGDVELYASSLESGNNINVYDGQGNFVAAGGNENLIPQIQEKCSRYPNFVSVSKYVKDNSNLENWSEYSLLS